MAIDSRTRSHWEGAGGDDRRHNAGRLRPNGHAHRPDCALLEPGRIWDWNAEIKVIVNGHAATREVQVS